MSMNIQSGAAAAMREAARFGEQISQITKAATSQIDQEIAGKEKAQADLIDMSIPSGYVKQTQKKLPTPPPRKVTKTEVPEEKKSVGNDINEQAKQFVKGHKEFDQESLEELRDQIKPDDSAEQILEKVKARFPKPSQAADAMEFLLLTTSGNLRNAVQAAKTQHYNANRREIDAGRQLTKLARETADQGIGAGDTKKLDQVFSDMVAEGADSNALYKQLSVKYDYKEMKKLLDFVSKSAGHELHDSKIEHSYLGALCREVRSIQGIMGVYRSAEKGMANMNTNALRDEERWKNWSLNNNVGSSIRS